MKKLLGLVILIVVLILGGYYITGTMTERTLEKNIEVFNQSNGLYVDIAKYDRGWFTSHAMLNWRLQVPERIVKNDKGESVTVAAQDYKIEMPLTIYHGPIIFSDTGLHFGLGYAHSTLNIPAAYSEKFSNLFTTTSIKPTLSLSLFVNYLNRSHLSIGLPSFKLISKQDNEQFEWNGMSGTINLSSDLRSIDGEFTIEGATLSKNNSKASISKISSTYDLHQTDTGIYLGNATLSLPLFTVKDNNQNTLAVEDLSLRSSSDITDGLFNSLFHTSLKKVTLQEKMYGPAEIEVAIKNLDAQVLADINKKSNELQQGTEANRQQALLSLLPELPKLFSKGAEFEISKLNVVLPEGTIHGDLLLSLPKGDTQNPFQLLQKVEGHGQLSVPAITLKQLITASIKQELLNNPSLQQTMVQQMNEAQPGQVKTGETPTTSQSATPSSATETPKNNVAPSETTTPAPTVTSAQEAQTPKPLSPEELQQQASAQADLKLSTMVQSGLIALQGNDYVIKVNLEKGQLSVNDNPFTPAMMQF